MKNISAIERFFRAFVGVIFLELAFFWVSGATQVAAYVVGGILVATAAFGFCPLYRILGIGRRASAAGQRPRVLRIVLAWVLLIAEVVGGSFASGFLTSKFFLKDFNAMNEEYKQTLYLTGKNEREKAVLHYENLLPAYTRFKEKYSTYRPYILRNDTQLPSDLARVAGMLSGVKELVHSGDLKAAHLGLEEVRPVFQEMFKRNGFSMLSVALVDFHDAMELMLNAAGAKDADKLLALYPQVSEKLKAVEAESNDAEVAAIRKNLDELYELAKSSQVEPLAKKSDELKSSFIKVYLKRG